MKYNTIKLLILTTLSLGMVQQASAMGSVVRTQAVKALQLAKSLPAVIPFLRTQMTKKNALQVGAVGLAIMGYRLLESDASIKSKFLSSIIIRGRPELIAEEAKNTSELNKLNRSKGIMLLDNNWTRLNVHMPIFSEHRQAGQHHKEQLSFGGHEYTITHNVEDGLLLRKHSFSIQFNK